VCGHHQGCALSRPAAFVVSGPCCTSTVTAGNTWHSQPLVCQMGAGVSFIHPTMCADGPRTFRAAVSPAGECICRPVRGERRDLPSRSSCHRSRPVPLRRHAARLRHLRSLARHDEGVGAAPGLHRPRRVDTRPVGHLHRLRCARGTPGRSARRHRRDRVVRGSRDRGPRSDPGTVRPCISPLR
jgi:hypothetical protein